MTRLTARKKAILKCLSDAGGLLLLDELRLQCLVLENQSGKMSGPSDHKRSFNRTVLDHFDEIHLERLYSRTSTKPTRALAGLIARWYLVQAIEAEYLTTFPNPTEIVLLVGSDACHSRITMLQGCSAAIGSALQIEDVWLVSNDEFSERKLKSYADVKWTMEGVVDEQWQVIDPITPLSVIDILPHFTPAGDSGYINSARRKFLF